MLTAGLADTAMLAFIAPAHNQLAHAAAVTYNRQLTDPAAGPIPFVPLTLEHAFTAVAAAGLPAHAAALHRRYTDWWLLDGELELTGTASAPAAAAELPGVEAQALRHKSSQPRRKRSTRPTALPSTHAA